MLEKQRLTYLEHLGISHYMPRRLLPNALPSQLLSDELLQEPTAFSTADTTVSEPGSEISIGMAMPETAAIPDTLVAEALPGSLVIDEPLVVKQGSLPKNVEELLDQTGKNLQDTAAIDSTTDHLQVTPNVSKSPSETLEFTLHIWRINQDLLVVDSHQPGSALPTNRLLQNILCSVGYPLAQLPPSELLRWPLFSRVQFASQSALDEQAEARAMVQAYIAAQCAKMPTRGVLLLGEQATHFALTPDDHKMAFFSRYQGSAIEQPQWQTTTLIAPSLIEMLQEPMKKRITWQALQFLINLS
ncbi:hypothetical protein AB835_09950 [Candidatus Endobugula sertula]|uniref:Uracil-DNA glycosylase-like domain-containing protein n=1 Tax=Candidatus Endobugula sertula TaxID=62101 RepID=A0A1D2QNP9_9GAMM|nr:hypothetical protein AB835_09950 [Candidatus Endobugula sertula]